MNTGSPAGCRECGSPIPPAASPRGGRPRQYCHTCRPSATTARRSGQLPKCWNDPCKNCGGEVERDHHRLGRPRVFCRTCRPDRPRDSESGPPRLDDLAADDDPPRVKAALDQLAVLAHAGAWTAPTLQRRVNDLRMLLATTPEGQPVRLSRIRDEFGAMRARVAARVLAEHGLLVDDTASRLERWIERRSSGIAPGFREDVHAWLVVLAAGESRARPRSEATLHAYLSRVAPPLEQWSHTRAHLREVTREDVLAVANSLSGHRRIGTLVALRSLFRFAKRRGVIFRDPTSRIHAGAAPDRVVLPMTDTQIASVTSTSAAPLQRITVALAAVYAARARALRNILLDDIDLSGRRIQIGAINHQLTDFTPRRRNDLAPAPAPALAAHHQPASARLRRVRHRHCTDQRLHPHLEPEPARRRPRTHPRRPHPAGLRPIDHPLHVRFVEIGADRVELNGRELGPVVLREHRLGHGCDMG